MYFEKLFILYQKPTMFRYFENLIDPYCEYKQTDTPPTKLWPYFQPCHGNAQFDLTRIWASIWRPRLCDCLCVWGFADVVTNRCKIDPAFAGVVAAVWPVDALDDPAGFKSVKNSISGKVGPEWPDYRRLYQHPFGQNVCP